MSTSSVITVTWLVILVVSIVCLIPLVVVWLVSPIIVVVKVSVLVIVVNILGVIVHRIVVRWVMVLVISIIFCLPSGSACTAHRVRGLLTSWPYLGLSLLDLVSGLLDGVFIVITELYH